MAALADGPMPVISWGTLAAKPQLADGFQHLVALDPPPGGASDPLLNVTPSAHLAWGPAEAEFAIAAYRATLDLRPQLTALYRALRELPAEPAPPRLRPPSAGRPLSRPPAASAPAS